MLALTRPAYLLLVAAIVACASPPPPSPERTAPPTASATTVTATDAPSPQPRPQVLNIRATRLAIPALHIDSPVQASQVVPDTSTPTPGCPALAPGGTTLTVPEHGIATPEEPLEGLDNRAWIFGHSRWQNQPGIFFSLQDISPGDHVLVEGVDRSSGAPVPVRRFVVEGIFLADMESGTRLVSGDSAADVPLDPLVILQTSVREDGANKQWLLSQQKIVPRARNIVSGDLNDPCKYLLLFVVARSA